MSDVFNQTHRWLASPRWDRPHLDRLARWTQSPKIPRVHHKDVPTVPNGRWSVSVVIPCYNYGRYLSTTLASVLCQTDIDLEVIVVDDASTDESVEIAATIAGADSRVRLVRQPINRGQVLTFNHGLSQATGDFVVRLDADDLLAPGSLARGVAAFEANPRVGLVYGHPREFPDPLVPQACLGTASWTTWSGQDWIRLRCQREVNALTTSEAMVRRSIVTEIGGFNPVMRFACDMEWWMRIAAMSDVLRINDVDQALHREHPDSLSATDGAGCITDLRERRLAFDSLFSAVGDRIDQAPVHHAVASRTLAKEALRHAVYAYDRGRVDVQIERSLVAFALDVDPTVVRSLQWRAYAVRRRLGPAAVHRDPLSLFRIARIRAKDELAYLQWTRTGL